MRIFLAWHNAWSNRRRLLVAASGIAFAILLMFMQLGSLDAVRRTATLVYDALEFDLILVSNSYQYMNRSGGFAPTHLAQARVVPGVGQVAPFNYDLATWEDPATGILSSVMLLGLELEPGLVRDPVLAEGLASIALPGRAMVDRLSSPSLGPLEAGRMVRINGKAVGLASGFRMGMGFYGQGAVVVGNRTFTDLVQPPGGAISFGLLRLAPGADPAAVQARLREVLPPEVVVFGREEFLRLEKDHYTTEMPLGILGRIGVLVAIFLGAVVLYQVLSTDLSNRLSEYATLKAAGFSTGYIYGVGLQQALIFALLGYFPALGLATLVYRATHAVTRLPIQMTWELALTVLALSSGMCLGAGLLALGKVRRADPAELL